MSKNNIPLLGSPLLMIILIIIAGIYIIAAKSYVYKEPIGEAVPTQSPKKVIRGEKHDVYITNPPSSGAYTEYTQRDGVFTEQMQDEQIVGALYKGKVAIIYNCFYKTQFPTYAPPPQPPGPVATESATTDTATSSAKNNRQQKMQTPAEAAAVYRQIKQQNISCGDTVSTLRKIVEKKGAYHLIMTPKNTLESRVALVAWGRIDKMMWADEKRISDFIDSYRGKKPKF